jgi:sugar phosphate isomerase/epimerase
MAQLTIGIQPANFNVPLKQGLHIAADLGVQVVEIDARNDISFNDLSDTAARQIRKMINDLNMQAVALKFVTRRGYGDADDLERRVDGTKRAMKMAYALGARFLVNSIGKVPTDQADPQWQMMKEVLSDLGNFGQKTGVLLTAETGSEPLQDLYQLIRASAEGTVGIALNPGNLLINGFDFHDQLTGVADHVYLVHAQDGVQDRARGRGYEVPLGRGSAEFPEIAAILEERQFSGAYVIQRHVSSGAREEIELAINYLRSL